MVACNMTPLVLVFLKKKKKNLRLGYWQKIWDLVIGMIKKIPHTTLWVKYYFLNLKYVTINGDNNILDDIFL